MQTTTVAQTCSAEAKAKASSLLDAKQSCISNLGEIVPANRSSLASDNCKIASCKDSRDNCVEVLHGRKRMLSQDHKVIDLDDSSQLDEKSKDIVMVPCFNKKRRFISGHYNLMQQSGNSEEHTSGDSF